MTKKKRELIDILLDNVKPEDWPESFPYAAQDIKSMDVNYPIYAYQCKPVNSDAFPEMWNQIEYSKAVKIGITPKDLCKYWNKTIVHRNEFMKRWDERNRVFVSITDQSPAAMDSAKYEALEFTDIGGDVEKTLTFSREGIAPVTLTEKMEKISITPNVGSEGWIKWNGGEMPVENGTLVDVKYRNGKINLHISAGTPLIDNGSITEKYACYWWSSESDWSIVAYRLHVPQEQKTPQQLALEKFGTDWHENEGVQPVNDKVLIDLIMCNGDEKKKYLANHWSWHKEQALKIKKWRIHSDEKESQIDKAAKSLSEVVEKLNGVLLTAQQAFDCFKKAAEAMGGAYIESIISERGNNCGRFEDGAEIMQQLKMIAHTSQGWERMKPVQREAMDMILHKIGRILNGDPNYIENYTDIAGYSNLVSSWLKGGSK